MIEFKEFDSDPYTGIEIYEDGKRKLVFHTLSFLFSDFEKFLMRQSVPKSVEEAESLVRRFEES